MYLFVYFKGTLVYKICFMCTEFLFNLSVCTTVCSPPKLVSTLYHAFDPVYLFLPPLPLFPSVGRIPICSQNPSLFPVPVYVLGFFVHLFFKIFNIWVKSWYLSVFFWLISLSIILSRFIFVVTMTRFYLFFYGWIVWNFYF